jgi:hypothetical protein
METKNEISVELGALSEPVSRISRQTPYGVPAGYFDRFPALVMGRITAKSSTFQVPEGYFDQFAGSVLARIGKGVANPGVALDGGASESVEEELARLSVTMSRISRNTPYEAPEGYFEELAPVLSVLRDAPTYQVPEGYFEELSPVLSVLRNRSTYQAPAGYFTEFASTVLLTVAQPAATAKIVPIEHRESLRREYSSMHIESVRGNGGNVLKGHWWKFSSAAAIAACLLLIFSWPQVGNRIGSGGLAVADLGNVSDNEIQAYLDDEHSILAEPVSTSTATLDMNEGEVKNLLGEVSDDDLQQYMEEHGKADDIATN